MSTKQKELKNAIQNGMLAWESWNWFHTNSWTNNGWVAAVEGVTDPAERSAIRRNVIDDDWHRENNQRSQQKGQRTRRYKRTAKAFCKKHGVKEIPKSKQARSNTETCSM
eukprot:11114333-Ditylum_brightwellii.AAC.1